MARLAAGGACVYFTYYRREDAAGETAVIHGAAAVRCPQGDGDAVEQTVERVVRERGGIDILVNNAGVADDRFVMMMPFESWRKVMDTNADGTFRWCKAVSRAMAGAGSGAIVNVASVSGLIGIAGQANYAASKGAILAMTRVLAAELGPRGVRVNAVVPGFIDTDMTARMPREIKREYLRRVLLKRLGRAEEIAAAVAFLASPESSYIAGQTLVVDGGLSATA